MEDYCFFWVVSLFNSLMSILLHYSNEHSFASLICTNYSASFNATATATAVTVQLLLSYFQMYSYS